MAQPIVVFLFIVGHGSAKAVIMSRVILKVVLKYTIASLILN